MIVNFTNKKISPNFKIFFINKDKKNLKYHNISSNSEIKKNVLNSLSKKKFKGSLGQICHIETINDKHAENTILFIGIGDETKIEGFNFQYFGGLLLPYLENLKYKKISIYVGNVKKVKLSYDNIILNFASGICLKSYSFKKYKKKKEKDDNNTLPNIDFITSNPIKFEKLFLNFKAVSEGVFFARDLIHEPPNVLNPVTLALRAKELSKLNVKVNILDEKKMKKLGMGALLGVGMGSANPSRLITLEWNGNPNLKSPPLGLVGKGVTFDTGGYSLKTTGMEEMKMDMGGSAIVLGVIKALALRKSKSNVVGVIGSVENMVSANAQRPSDIVKSMSGQTIEVLNTDAEGRLVLADALWYCQEKYNVKKMINFATLTGAIIAALGNFYAGLFSNSDKLSDHLIKSGKKTDEKIWRFPLGKEYDDLLNCDIADVKNITGTGGAGSITAAQFLQRFVKKDVEWAHLDIAGVTWLDKDQPLSKKGGTAFGVRLIDNYIYNNHEKK